MEQQTIKQMEQTVAELLAKAEELKQLIEKEKQKEDVWPNIDDVYYYIDSCGVIGDCCWDGDKFDTALMEIDNVFRTEEDAEKVLTKRKIETKLRNLANKAWKDSGKGIDWQAPDKNKWCVFLDHTTGTFRVYWYCTNQMVTALYFPTEQSARDAVKEIGEDNLKLLFM